ncbi:unnamed protein product, partial [Ranitomeya imitator]
MMNTRSQSSLDHTQLRLLQRGLSFYPTYRFNTFQLDLDLQRFYRNLRLKAFFYNQVPLHRPENITTTTPLNLPSLGLRLPSKFNPPKNNPPVETFISLTEKEVTQFTKQISRNKLRYISNPI